MTKFKLVPLVLFAAVLLPHSAHAQSADPAAGRDLAERVCIACHQVGAAPSPFGPPSAPSFIDISQMPSTTELAIKVFLRTSHQKMPNIILSEEEIDSVAAYIVSLAKQ